MSLTAHHANLSSNAKASGKKLVLKIIKQLDIDRSAWLSDVVLKSSLLGTHDTVRTQWSPKNYDHDVKYLGSTVGLTIKSKKSAEDIKVSTASEKQTDASQPVEAVKVEKHPLATPAKEKGSSSSQGGGDKEKEQQEEIKLLREYVARLETEKSLKLKQELAAKVAATSADATDKQHQGLFGLREDQVVEDIINAEYGKQKIWTHPISGMEETPSQREMRMIMYDMIVTSLQHFKSMYTGELVGDNFSIVRNVVKYGAPNSMRMKIDLTKKLGNYEKKHDQGYQDYALGLRVLIDELAAVGYPMKEDLVTLHLIAGMTNDRRYDRECKELSDRAESYSVCNNVFVMKAQTLGNLTSKLRTEEANAATTHHEGGGRGKGKGGRGQDSQWGGRGKGKGKGGKASKSPRICSEFLMKGDCSWDKECGFTHMTLDEVQKMKEMNSQKPKNTDGEPDQVEGRRARRRDQWRSKDRRDQPCYAYQSTGTCPRTPNCPFSHELDVVADSEVVDSDAESSNVLEILEEGGSPGPDSRSALLADQPMPEQVLSAAVVGDQNKKKRTPMKGGGGCIPPLKTRHTTRGHKGLSVSKSTAVVPYATGSVRRWDGRKREVGASVEINLPGRQLHGIRCLITELWETKTDVPYAKLQPLLIKEVDENALDMLTTVGIRVQDLTFLDCVQPEDLLYTREVDMDAILDSGATRTIVPNESYLVKGTMYKLDKPLLFKGYDKGGDVQAARYAGTIALRSNTSTKGHLLLVAYVLPAARRALISMSQLDDGGNYVDMGGGGLRLRMGADHSNFLALPRLQPSLAKSYAQDLHREYVQDRDVTWDFSDAEKSSLYPVPRNLFRTDPFSDWEWRESGVKFEAGIKYAASEGGEVSLATRYSEKEKLELRHAQLAHRSMLQLQIMMNWDGDGPRPKPHIVCWCAACVIAKCHAGTPTKKPFSNASRAPLDHVYADCSVDMGESVEGYKHFLCITETHWHNYFVFLLRTKAEAKEWLAVWIKKAELQHYPHKVRNLHIDGGELKTTDAKMWAAGGGGTMYVSTPGNHEAQAKVERPIRTITEASRAIVAHGNGDNVRLWPVGCIAAAKALKFLPPMKVMKIMPFEGEPPFERPLTPHEGWTGRKYPDYKTQWKCLLTPLCEVVAHLDKHQRGSKTVNPGVPCLYLCPAYDNTMELSDHLCIRYSDGKRIRARYVYANEDRMPLRDGPSPGLVMHHSILELRSVHQNDGYIHRTGVSPTPRFVESSGAMATAQDMGRDSRMTSVVEDDEDENKADLADQPPSSEHGDRSLDFEPGSDGPATVQNDDPQPVEARCLDEQDEKLDTTAMPPLESRIEFGKPRVEEAQVVPSPPEPTKEGEAPMPVPDVEVKQTVEIDRRSSRISQRYLQSDLYKPKPREQGSTVETMWGTATVYKSRINGDLELTWPGHDEAGVHTIKATDVDKLTWRPDEKQDRYDYAGNRVKDIEQAKLIYEVHALQESKTLFVGNKFLDVEIGDLKGKVRAAAVNAALPQPDHMLTWDHPFQQLVKPAKEKELTGLCEKGTFGAPRELPFGHKKIPVMFVNVAKDDDKGMFDKVKSRLTVMGNKMKGQVSQADAYSPVTHPMSYKIILILHLNDPKVDFDVYDVEQAFLSVNQERKLYVGHPKGYVFVVDSQGTVSWRALAPREKPPKTVVPVYLALYGSVESGKLFFSGWVLWHVAYGFKTIHYDKCYLVLEGEGGNFIKMSYHVDDGLIAHKGESMWRRYKQAVSRRFAMKYVSLAEKKKFLGMRFHLDRQQGMVHIEQSALIMKMLMHFNMQDCDASVLSPFLNPMPTKADIPEKKEDQEMMQKSFDMYAAIGYLNYIQMGTRMDISCPLKILSQFAAKFGKAHVALAKHMMRWLKRTINHQITLFGVKDPQIQLFTDTSHASNPDTRKSITAVIGKLGGNTIFWKCLYQTIVSHSSCESELMALDKGATMGMFLRWMTEALGGVVITPVPIFVDNQGAIALANNPVGPNRNLHIHARYFYVRDLVDGQEYAVYYVSTKDQLADMLCTYKGSASFDRFFDLASRCSIMIKNSNDIWEWKILK